MSSRTYGTPTAQQAVEGRETTMKTGLVQLISTIVGLSVGVGVMTATVLLGVAALLE
jgi:hypothetical protein